ncbi:GNAT family N-acetyltransferase [Calothrix sp. FACHB-1219]|uniref:GNAT family N-acetyltransferase n=1 Tax=unclassified Calothrix TaxID=2619626 RepID=UPI0016896B34|nr:MULTISPECIES: GNAT family N-acetyltransferase [unclassified Calothrix]MBD2202050.1 GNAT family N-acetyltransferase [Calothrix sp. FACHB-168]MBD2217086.1 GNAT family N-acetyltransferase [Calothrix sp. FACHB-1219]
MDKVLEKTSSVTLRAGRPEDALHCGTIVYQAFSAIAEQYGYTPDFPSAEFGAEMLSELLADPNIYSVVAETADGRVVGSNFLWEGDAIAGIGPTTVDPAAQNLSVGRRLMEHVLQRTQEKGYPGVRLVQAAYNSRSLSLYTKLGFNVREPLANLQGQPFFVTIPGRIVRPVTAADIASCNQLCDRIHGHNRAGELKTAFERGTATLVEYDGRISGYATEIGFFGHAVGENNEDLKALIGAAPAFAGSGFYVPMRNGDLFRWCLDRGLRFIQPETLMSIGLYNEPTGVFIPSALY